jgi:MFS family permease
MAVPFYVLFADRRIGLSGADLGTLTAAFVLTQSVGNLVWGLLADRRGFRFVFLASLLTWMASVLVLMQVEDLRLLVGVFLGLGAGLGGFQMSAQSLVLEFGSRHDLPMRIAVANTASELVAALGSVLGGLLVISLSYVPVFWLALACQAAAVAIVLLAVDEPRRR